MWRALYTLVLRAAAPFILLRLWWRGWREPGYHRRIGERFGLYREGPRPASARRPVLWVHAVSVGEARASAALVRALAAAHPGHEMLVTCMTAAGRETLHELHGDSVRIAWLPYDYPGAVRRFLAHYRPRLAVLMETEIWPNLFAASMACRCCWRTRACRRSRRAATRVGVGWRGRRLLLCQWCARRARRTRRACARLGRGASWFLEI